MKKVRAVALVGGSIAFGAVAFHGWLRSDPGNELAYRFVSTALAIDRAAVGRPERLSVDRYKVPVAIDGKTGSVTVTVSDRPSPSGILLVTEAYYSLPPAAGRR